jgi:hypothetical protein
VQLLQHNLGPPVVFFKIAVNIYDSVLQLANITDILEVPGEDDHGEGTDSEVLAEVEKCNAVGACLDPKNRSRDTLGFADV